MRTRRPLVVLALVAALAPALRAQGYFGQNQVQFKQLDWKVIPTEHFEVHFYPEMEQGARIAARMAERSYARLSRLLNYQFREKRPIVLFASRGDFAQNNVTGDLGEGTGGVTDAIKLRNMFFFGQDLAEVQHVMTHEMVHQFQYDVQFRGRGASPAMEAIGGSQPPLWFIEGMAEYLSIGPDHPATDAVIRDAALNGNLPSIEQMTQNPDRWFPYRYGESFWRFVGKRWGDEIIGEILLSAFSLGIDRSFKRYTGYDLEELGEEWKETMQTQYLPAIGTLDRPRKIAQPLLNARRTGGIIPVYVAPALSSDGRNIAYISTGSLLRAEVFLDLYLADAQTGKRIKKLTNSTMNAETEELRYAYSQSAFSPDGKVLAYTAQRHGKDVLYLLDVRTRAEKARFDTQLDQMIGPTWSPDGRLIAFSGSRGGMTNLYVIDADGKNLRQLTNDPYAALMPSWSPDGKKIAFVSDRGPDTDLTLLKFGKWRISVLDLDSKEVEVIPAQGGKNLNPQWSPDGKSIAFISDRTGIPQLFLYDFDAKAHYQLTKFIGGVASVTENSPAMTWARQADKLAFVYMDNGDYTIWSISNPRQLKKDAFKDVTPSVVAQAPAAGDTATENARARAAISLQSMAQSALRAARDSTFGRRMSLYRGATGLRPSEEPPAPGAPGSASAVSVAALMDSAAMALPAENSLKVEPYRATLRPEAILRPQIGYAQDNYSRGVYGGTAILLGDLLDNRQLLISGSLNGRFEEAQAYILYNNSAHRRNYQLGLMQQPYFYLSNFTQSPITNGNAVQTEVLTRYIMREGFGATIYPFNRFNRMELGASFTSLDRADMYISQQVNYNYGVGSGFYLDSIKGRGTLNYGAPFIAYVSDNALHSMTGPIYGHRFRFEVSPIIAADSGWVNYTADVRRYDAILFSFLTLASRFYTNMAVGKGEQRYLKYIGLPQYIRGYDRENYLSAECGTTGTNGTSADASACSATQLLGSRIAMANVELRFPLIRRFDLGILPISLPPLDGLVFYDAGMAWSGGQTVSLTRPGNYDFNKQRFPLRSYGYGLRLNLFNMAIIRWDYAIPRDAFNKKGYWWWSIGPSF